MKWYWKLCVPLMVILLFLSSGCTPGRGEIKAIYDRFIPMVVDKNQTTDVVYEVKVEGSPTAVKLKLESTGNEILLRDDGSDGDKVAGDGIYTITLGAADVLYNFTPDDVNRNFIGYLRLYLGREQKGEYNIFADIMTTNIPPVKIKIVSSEIQYTEHLVNIVNQGFFSSFSIPSVTKKFYSYFDDNYDFINVIYEISYIENSYHFGIRNDIKGIGITQFDNTAAYGSGSRLLGCTVFPIPTIFDGASPHYQHELGHQWINFLPVPPLNYATPHWPLSDLASGIMGWGTGKNTQGLSFNFDLVPVGSNFQLVANYNPEVYTDLSLYLMGFIPARQVSEHFVFYNQSLTPTAGGMLLGPVTYISITDIINQIGLRIPDNNQAQKKFRVATIIVSKDGLLSENAMRLYDYFSARAEETQIVTYSSGFVKGQTKPFHLTTQGMGRLDVRIKRHILVDASRDGGVWWFPQAGPFDPVADHQGRALVKYIRLRGHKVVELPRPYTITAELLADYDIVIRAVGFGKYAQTEITAYMDYVQNGGNLLLLADHGPSDDLAMGFGLQFKGATRGENLLTSYISHPITQGVGSLFYNCGGGLISFPSTAQILGMLSNQSYLDLNNNGIKDSGEPSGPPVLGVMTYGIGRIVFCGDTNLWEAVPQPLIDNVLQWFADP